jgi:site-specific DNA-methyltransferase (adenine-specific)
MSAGWRIMEGDAVDLLRTLEPASIDAVVTSPPYAQQRRTTYGGVKEDRYPWWTVEWFEALRPALKPGASVILNIRPHVKDGQVSDYVLLTRLALRDAGWYELDELIWLKGGPPMGHVERPRRAWESLLWFAPSPNVFCDPKANGNQSKRVGGPEGGRQHWDHVHGEQGPHSEGWARCADVVDINVAANGADDGLNTHPAPYPVPLAVWCVRLICPYGGTVLDPFCGSGSTGLAALRQGRGFVGVEVVPEYAAMARARILADAPLLNTMLEAA